MSDVDECTPLMDAHVGVNSGPSAEVTTHARSTNKQRARRLGEVSFSVISGHSLALLLFRGKIKYRTYLQPFSVKR